MNDLIRWFQEEDTVSLVPLLAIGILIIVTPIFLGGNGYEGESFLFLLTGPIAYFTWKSDPDAFYKAIRRPVSIVFFLFVCATALSLIPSADRFSSLTSLVNWIALYTVFISASVVVSREKCREILSNTVIISAAVLSVVGIYGFLLYTSNFGYLRLTSTFDQHNAFGGFLLFPLALLLGRLCAAKSLKAFALWGAALTLVGSTFILTFSRGSWVSFVFGVIVAIFFSRKKAWELLKDKKVLIAFFGVGLAITTVSWGALHFTSKQAAAESQTVGVFTGETIRENALTARLQYFRDALVVIKHNPILGVGIRHYGEAVKLYKDTPAFYASSPHNEYLKMFAEVGVIGGFMFTVLIVLMLVKLLRSTRRAADSDTWPMQAGLLAGGVAVCAHLGMEVDWGYVANPLLFFALMGSLYNEQGEEQETPVLRESSLLVRTATTLVILVAVVVSLLGVGYWHQMYHTEQGVVLLHQNKLSDAFLELKEAYRFSDFNPSPHYFAALTLEQASRLTPDVARKKSFLTEALGEMHRVIQLKPKRPLFYSWQALIYQGLGDDAGYQQALEMTVKYNPIEGIYEYGQLVTLYNSKKEYEKVITLSNKILPYYPLDMYANPYWVNPEKGTVWRQVAEIYTQLSIAYAEMGDSTRAKEAKTKALLYNTNVSI